jgi:prepilin-type N-terminal cleavage/methylation domain-containing protein/prepilin-type processing-associated H-X9-DG protein
MHSPSCFQSGPRAPRAAFTLIELLTVIAIIGILAAILIPTVGRVRQSAATAADMSNLKQIGQAIQLHIADRKGVMPNQYTAPIPGVALKPDGTPLNWTFPEAVDRYFGITAGNPVFNPASVYNFANRGDMWFSKFAEVYPGFAPPSPNQTRPLAYGYNPYVNHTNWRTIYKVPSPSRIVIVGEANEPGGYKMFRDMMGQGTYDPTMVTVADQRSTYRVNRSGKALYLFCDGHVASLEGDQSEPALTAAGKVNIWRWW